MKLKRKNRIIIKPFNLIELLAAMVLFIFLMLIMVTMVSSTQQTFSSSVDRDNIYSNAQIALDLISRDLQSSLYEEDKISFWQEGTNKLNFIAVGGSSKICEIRYKTENNIIKRSALDPSKHNWNFYKQQLSSAMHAGEFQDIMPNVTELKFTCFNKDGTLITPSPTSDTTFPYSVKVDITCLGNKAYKLYQETLNLEYKKQNERKFTRTVYLGERY